MVMDELEVKTSVRRVITGNRGAKPSLPATCWAAVSLQTPVQLCFKLELNLGRKTRASWLTGVEMPNF
jgi:hypothetical protein